MRQDDSSRRSSLFQNLFAERQVYLRSGPASRYVVISRPLQIGVTLGLLLVLGWLAFASYSSVARHLEAVEQSREIARLEGVNKSLRTVAETAGDAEEARVAAEQVPQLQAELAEARAARVRAEQLAAASADEAEEMRRELGLVEQRLQEATARLAEAEAERETMNQQLEAAGAGAAEEAPVEAADLRQELEAAAQQIEQLSTERAELQERLEEVQASTAGSGDRVAELTQQLEAAQAQIEQLEPAREDALELEQQLAGAQDRIEELDRTVAELRDARQELETRLGEAELAAQTAEAPEEVAALRQQLEAATARIAELTGQEAAAREQLATVEQQLEQTQQEPTVTAVAQQLGALKPNGDGLAMPAYTASEQAIAALEADLAEARRALESLQGETDAAEELAALTDKLGAASEWLNELDLALGLIKARDAAMQVALTTLAPLPPPPAPR